MGKSEYCFDYSFALRSLIHRTVEIEEIEIIRMLIQRNVDINSLDAYGNAALHLACEIQNERIISFFLKMARTHCIKII